MSLESHIPRRVLVALGGNAFAKPGRVLTMEGQLQFAREAVSFLTPLLDQNVSLVLTHGNGPQVGHILSRVEAGLGKAYSIPLEVCVAESEGELGYVLEQALHNLLVERGRTPSIATLLTQVVVDPDDPAFTTSTKPIGAYYDREQAAELTQKGFALQEDRARGGYRRVVPSPAPKDIIEWDVIDKLLKSGTLVIAAGGGGIPVVRDKTGQLCGVEAVVDKDLASALLGEKLGARLLVILTDVPCVYTCFGSPQQQPITTIDIRQAARFCDEGHFAVGSMKPKMEAAIRFANRPGARTIICDPPSLQEALLGRAGTIICSGE